MFPINNLVPSSKPLPATGPEFQIACASIAPAGTAVIGYGTNVHNKTELNAVLSQAVKDNGNKPLDEVVFQIAGDGALTKDGLINFINSMKGNPRYIKDGATISLADGNQYGLSPQEFQAAADATGAKIVVPGSNGGVDVYQKGKPPQHDPNGTISNGGLGTRGIEPGSCTDPAGYHDVKPVL